MFEEHLCDSCGRYEKCTFDKENDPMRGVIVSCSTWWPDFLTFRFWLKKLCF